MLELQITKEQLEKIKKLVDISLRVGGLEALSDAVEMINLLATAK